MAKARISALLIAALLVGLLFHAQTARAAVTEALSLCAGVLIPALFPFCVGMNLFLSLAEQLGTRLSSVMKRLFRLPGAAAVALLAGLLGGYPLGAAMTARLSQQGALSRQEAVTLSCFSNNAGPAFVLGAVGGAVFGAAQVGLWLYLLHVFSALMVGLLLRKRQSSVSDARPQISGASLRALPQAISAAAGTMLNVCAAVVFSSVLLALLCEVLPVGRLPDAGLALFKGAIELTNGCMALSALPFRRAFPLAALMLGWGGLCVHLQALSMLSEAKLPISPYLRAKLLQALLSYLLAKAVILFFF